MYKKILLPIILFTALTNFQSFAGNWIEKGNDWYYEGSTGWIREYGYSYYIEDTGKMRTDDLIENGLLYQFNKNNKEIPEGALIESNQIIINEKKENGISFLEIKKENTTPDKIVFLLHGLGGKKEEYKGYGTEIADRGYLVIIPDAYAHGNTDGMGSYPDIIKQSSENINTIRDIYDKERLCETSIIGCSMGGMIASYYVSEGNKVENLGLIISTTDFSKLNDDIFYYDYKEGNQTQERNKEIIYKELCSMSPIENNRAFNDINIISINSGTDNLIDYNSAIDAMKLLKGDIRLTDVAGHHASEKDFMTVIDAICNFV